MLFKHVVPEIEGEPPAQPGRDHRGRPHLDRPLNGYATSFSADSPLPKPAAGHAAVGTWFDLAGSLLTEQRALATTLVDAGTAAAETVTERAAAAVAPLPPAAPAG